MSEQYVAKPYELVAWTIGLGYSDQGETIISMTPTFQLPAQTQLAPSPLFVLSLDNTRLLIDHLARQLQRAEAMLKSPPGSH